MIVVGLSPSVKDVAVLHLTCRGCGRTGVHRLTRTVQRFALFFVPLVPVSSRHTLECLACGHRRRPPADVAADLVRRFSA